MDTELFISWRYLFTKRKEKFLSMISVISILGVAIGVAALIMVIAVMTGFDQDLRDKIVGNYSHITVAGYSGIDKSGYEGIVKAVSANQHTRGISPYVQAQVLIKQGGSFVAVSLRGIDPETEGSVTKIDKYLVKGSLKDLTAGEGVIVGKEMASYLGLDVGTSVSVYSASGRQRDLKVAGLFSSGMYDYDTNLIFTHIKLSQDILELGDKITAVAVKLDNLYLADKIKAELGRALGFDYSLKTWMEANQNFFAALKLEKLTMFIILTLVILVASFNIASTLIVMVVEKTKDIGILKSLGMSSGKIRKVFTCEGLIIGTLGTFFGACAGVALCLLLKKYQFIKLPQDIYYIDRLPVSIDLWPDVALIVLVAFAITLISTVYPATRAGRLKPVEALRYE